MKKSFGYLYFEPSTFIPDEEYIYKALGYKHTESHEAQVNNLFAQERQQYKEIYKQSPEKSIENEILNACKLKVYAEIMESEPMVQKGLHYVSITHKQFGLMNIDTLAAQLSKKLKAQVIGWSGFDDSVIRLCIYSRGKIVDEHIIGDALDDFGLCEKRANVDKLILYLSMTIEQAEYFIGVNDVIEAKDYIFSFLGLNSISQEIDISSKNTGESWLPKDMNDFAKIKEYSNYTYAELEPHLLDIMYWLVNYDKWPIVKAILPILIKYEFKTAYYAKHLLDTLHNNVRLKEAIILYYAPLISIHAKDYLELEIKRIATAPMENEKLNGLQLIAKEYLSKHH